MNLPQVMRTAEGWSVAGASPALLLELLEVFSAECKQAGFDLDRTCNPGLDPAEVVRIWADSGVTAPAEAITWWSWRNGYKFPSPTDPGTGQLPIQHALDLYALQPKGDDEYSWNPLWIPIWGAGPDSICMNTSVQATSPLIRATEGSFGTQASETSHQVVSLCTPVTWWLIGIRESWIRPVDGHWKSDWEMIPPEWRRTNLAHI